MSQETFDFIADPNTGEVWKGIPMDFKKSADSNPEKFMRDFGAKPSLVLEAFDRDGNVVERNVSSKLNPMLPSGKFADWFVAKDKEPRFIHIDLGLKRDACGISMTKLGGYVMIDNERRMKVEVELMTKLQGTEEQEISFEDVRQLIYSLSQRGFNIRKITFDGWQSVDIIQILRTKGYDVEVQSIDRTTEAYDTLKSLLHLNLLDYYKYEPFLKEYKQLELVKGKKVDHPPQGSKDVADAVAGATRNCVAFYDEFRIGHFDKGDKEKSKPRGLLAKEF